MYRGLYILVTLKRDGMRRDELNAFHESSKSAEYHSEERLQGLTKVSGFGPFAKKNAIVLAPFIGLKLKVMWYDGTTSVILNRLTAVSVRI